VTPTVHLVDASVYVFRAYFSQAPEFTDVDGDPVHAVFGFLGFLLGMLEQAKPSHVGIAYDVSLTTSFRNRIYPAYKANRELPPADLDKQFGYCRELTAALGLAGLAHDEFEADDLIGSVLHRARGEGYRGVIVTSDKDLSQLITAEDRIWDFARKERYGVDGVVARMGVRPEQIADYLALCGDAVDNIPGVAGIGPKTAAALLAHFETLDALLARLDEVPFLSLRGAASTAKKLREQQEMARLCRQLTAIALDAPVPAIDALAVQRPDAAKLEALLDRLKFGPLTRRRIREYAERVP
jgi:5'-3' exonuclease